MALSPRLIAWANIIDDMSGSQILAKGWGIFTFLLEKMQIGGIMTFPMNGAY